MSLVLLSSQTLQLFDTLVPLITLVHNLVKDFLKIQIYCVLVPLCPHSTILSKNSSRSVRQDFLLYVNLAMLPLSPDTMFIYAFSYHILYYRLYHLTTGRSQTYQHVVCKISSRVLSMLGSYTGSSPILWHSYCLWWQVTLLANCSAISHECHPTEYHPILLIW